MSRNNLNLLGNESRIVLWVGTLIAVGALYVLVLHFVVGGAPYQAAADFITTNVVVQRELGSIQHIGLSWLSSFSSSGPWGVAELRCPITGAKGEAVAIVKLALTDGLWVVTEATLDYGGQQTQLPLH